MHSDLMQRDFLAAAHGHQMNNCSVVTSSVYADIAYILRDYLYRKFYPRAERPDMDITNLVVTKALIAKKGFTSTPQSIQVTARTIDIHSGTMDLTWQNVEYDGSDSGPFATANIVFGDSDHWLSTWSPVVHLIQHRIEMLETLAAEGQANRLSCMVIYTLWAKDLVDYVDKYRGMQSIVMHELEAFADVQLSTKEDNGKWAVPPYFIDSVARLAGFVLNCSDAIDTQNNYGVTSGWKWMRFAGPLVAGGRYRSYVKMILTKEDTLIYLGGVYVLRANGSSVIGMVSGMHFRRFPRILLGRFFCAPEVADTAAHPTTPSFKRKKPNAVQAQPDSAMPERKSSSNGDSGFDESQPFETARVNQAAQKPVIHSTTATSVTQQTPSLVSSVTLSISAKDIATPRCQGGSGAEKALVLIARVTGLDLAGLDNEAEFANVGIDSLMSLVLAEKFQIELNVKGNGSLFLDYPTIGDLREWLNEDYS